VWSVWLPGWPVFRLPSKSGHLQDSGKVKMRQEQSRRGQKKSSEKLGGRQSFEKKNQERMSHLEPLNQLK
jgi:hypothetical protein